MTELLPPSTCPTCGSPHQAWQRFCHHCGQQLQTGQGLPPAANSYAPYSCPHCSVAVFAGQRVCGYCGLGLDATTLAAWQAARRVPTQQLAPPELYSPPAPSHVPPQPGAFVPTMRQPPQPAYFQPPQLVQNNYHYQQIIVQEPKNVFLAVLLAFLFGPLGMLYSTVVGALVMLLVTVLMICATSGLGMCLIWPVCIIWAAVAADSSNRRLVQRVQ